MAFETWLMKLKKSISHRFDPVRTTPRPQHPKLVFKKSKVGVLAFEIAGLMSKLLHIWQSLSEKNITRLRNEAIALEGVRKIVSNDDSFLLGLSYAEMVENLKQVAKSVSRLSKRCEDSSLRSLDRLLDGFADTCSDPNNWVQSLKDMEAKCKKMNEYVSITATLHKEMDELSLLENSLKKSMVLKSKECSSRETFASDMPVCDIDRDNFSRSSMKEQKIMELQQKILCQKQQVKYLKERSLWCRSFDTVISMLAKSIFTVIAKIKLVFGIGHLYPPPQPYLPRSLSASAMVYPSENTNQCEFVSGPLKMTPFVENKKKGFFESNSMMLKPIPNTLGSAALALHYANLIIVMEKMIKSPQLIGIDARNDLYSMLPNSIRSLLRCRLKGIGFSATDPGLAAEWRDAVQKILSWLSPLAHNMIRWQSERSFEQQKLIMPRTNVLLFQTLYFANQDKTEAAITELLVGLNYIWRFEREMNARALFESINFNVLMDLQNSSYNQS